MPDHWSHERDWSTFPEWQRPSDEIDDFLSCEFSVGRQFMVRLTDGADPVIALANFAKKKNIRFANVHNCSHGTMNPTRYNIWIYDYNDPEHWNLEGPAVNNNNTMLCALSGMISMRPDGKGGEEPFAAVHFVSGGCWDSGTICGHLLEGSRVRGTWQVVVSEVLGVEQLNPNDFMGPDYKFPPNWFRELKG